MGNGNTSIEDVLEFNYLENDVEYAPKSSEDANFLRE